MGFFQRIGREATLFSRMLQLARKTKQLTPDTTQTYADIIERFAREKPDNVAIRSDDRVITYKEYDALANRYARWALAQGLKRGDVVALLMENRPEYLSAWLGIVKIGATAALINTNQTDRALAHSLNISGAKHLILGAECAENLSTALHLLESPLSVWATGGLVQGTNNLDPVLDGLQPAPLPPSTRDGVKTGDKALYIYTSGTTGLPKAATITHLRLQNMMFSFAVAMQTTERDRMYVVLPLYHSAGGICAIGSTLTVGGSVILRRKFSATQFWDDVVKYEATLFEYIGELCRYLLNTPPHPLERAHKLRVAMGNGLRPEIWPAFQSRFAIPRIIEFYGATEGNVALVNFDNKVGAIGRVPKWLRSAIKTRIVRFDVEHEQPVRDPATGFCTECAPGEVGEAIGKIDPSDPRSRFDGYSKSSETEKKILRDVFEKGDAWFRTGDLLKQDAEGYFFFVDRIGDTFRWKGENVATSEVAEALSVFPGIKEANVYGVHVPGADGRAGMASLVPAGEISFPDLYGYLEKNVPSYARPIFIRLKPEIEVTGTFKHRKVDLVKEGFDPAAIAEPLYFRDDANKTFVPLDGALHAQIASGALRL